MAEIPIVPILFTTFNRTECAIKTIAGITVNLEIEPKKDGTPRLAYYIADGGSKQEHHEAVVRLTSMSSLIGSHNVYQSPGANWNQGIQAIFDLGYDIYLRMEDDFELKEPLNILNYVKLLVNHDDIGMVRLGLMPARLDLKSIGIDGQIYFDVQKTQQYVYSGHPCLVHKRFHDAYGMYPVDLKPGDTEIMFDQQVREREGPRIVFPMLVAGAKTYGVFAHIGTKKSI